MTSAICCVRPDIISIHGKSFYFISDKSFLLTVRLQFIIDPVDLLLLMIPLSNNDARFRILRDKSVFDNLH